MRKIDAAVASQARAAVRARRLSFTLSARASVRWVHDRSIREPRLRGVADDLGAGPGRYGLDGLLVMKERLRIVLLLDGEQRVERVTPVHPAIVRQRAARIVLVHVPVEKGLHEIHVAVQP